MHKIIKLDRMIGVVVFGCIILVSWVIATKAETKDASSYAQEAATYAAQAYKFAQKINYNSNGRVKYYSLEAMDAAKKLNYLPIRPINHLSLKIRKPINE